jgi:hypothetical protein
VTQGRRHCALLALHEVARHRLPRRRLILGGEFSISRHSTSPTITEHLSTRISRADRGNTTRLTIKRLAKMNFKLQSALIVVAMIVTFLHATNAVCENEGRDRCDECCRLHNMRGYIKAGYAYQGTRIRMPIHYCNCHVVEVPDPTAGWEIL